MLKYCIFLKHNLIYIYVYIFYIYILPEFIPLKKTMIHERAAQCEQEMIKKNMNWNTNLEFTNLKSKI